MQVSAFKRALIGARLYLRNKWRADFVAALGPAGPARQVALAQAVSPAAPDERKHPAGSLRFVGDGIKGISQLVDLAYQGLI